MRSTGPSNPSGLNEQLPLQYAGMPTPLAAPMRGSRIAMGGVAPYPTYGPSYSTPLSTTKTPRRLRWLMLSWQVAIIGYLTFGKSFATIGVAPLLVSEPLLAYYFFRERGKVLNMLLTDLMKMRSLAVIVVAVFLWGIFDVIRPIVSHTHPALAALRTNAFDYYPLFIFAGLRIGKLISFDALAKYWKTFLIAYFLYVIAFYGFPKEIDVPWGGSWPLMMLPWNPPFAPLLLLSFWPLWKKWNWRWVVLPASLVPMAVSTGRGSFLGFVGGLCILAVASRKHRQLIGGFVVMATLILMLVGPLIHGEKGRNENLDPYIQVARVVATVNPDFAYDMLKKRGYDEAADDIVVARGTAEWREKIWTNCMASLNTMPLLLMGQGHGAPLVDYIPDGQDITTPHNFVIYATFYTGVIGAGLYILMLVTLLMAGRKIKEPHIWALFVANIVMTVMVAAVGNALETPMVAVPLYLISGICLGLRLPKRYPATAVSWQQPAAWMPAPSIA